ncbi:MAG: hypothetical protein AB8H79_07430 [Myxococcota bacterium]
MPSSTLSSSPPGSTAVLGLGLPEHASEEPPDGDHPGFSDSKAVSYSIIEDPEVLHLAS